MTINASSNWVHSESVGIEAGDSIVNTSESALPPEPHVQVYVPGVIPKAAIVVELYVPVPLKLCPETYPNGTRTEYCPIQMPTQSPEPDDATLFPPAPMLLGPEKFGGIYFTPLVLPLT